MNKVAFTFYSFEGSWSSIILYDGTAEDAMAEYELAMEERRKAQDKAREMYFKTDASKYLEVMNKWPPKFEVVVGEYLLEAREPETLDFSDINECRAQKPDDAGVRAWDQICDNRRHGTRALQ